MFDSFDSIRAVIESAKLDTYLSLLQGNHEALEMFRLLLANGCPPKAINAFIEHKISQAAGQWQNIEGREP